MIRKVYRIVLKKYLDGQQMLANCNFQAQALLGSLEDRNVSIIYRTFNKTQVFIFYLKGNAHLFYMSQVLNFLHIFPQEIAIQ